MECKAKIGRIIKYCGSYAGHSGMIDERNNQDVFHIVMSEEKMIQKELENLKVIILTGEAGDGKSRIIRKLKDELIKDKYKIIDDFSALSDIEKDECIKLINEIINEKSNQKLILAANVGVFTRKILAEQRELYDKLTNDSDEIKIINFERRNLASDKNIFYTIVRDFIGEEQVICSETDCPNIEHCPYMYNINMLRSTEGLEAMRVLCDVIYLSGGHMTFRELLSLIAYTVTFGKNCDMLKQQPEQWKRFLYTHIFDVSDDILMGKIAPLDPARKRIKEDIGNGIDDVSDFVEWKRQRFFTESNHYERINMDYLEEFRSMLLHMQDKPHYFDMKEDKILLPLKEGLAKLASRNNTDLGMYIVDTPQILGNGIKTEFCLELNNKDMIWHHKGIDFNYLDRELMSQHENILCLSMVYMSSRDESLHSINLNIDYSICKYLMMIRDDTYISKNSETVEIFTINEFYRKILRSSDNAYNHMKIVFDGMNEAYTNLDLELFEKNAVLFQKDKKIKIKLGD